MPDYEIIIINVLIILLVNSEFNLYLLLVLLKSRFLFNLVQ